MIPLRTARDPFADDPFLAALRSAGAHSRKAARPVSELPPVSKDFLAALVASDIVREAGNGRYYLVSMAAIKDPAARFTPLSVTLMMLVWIVVLLVPVIALWFIR